MGSPSFWPLTEEEQYGRTHPSSFRQAIFSGIIMFIPLPSGWVTSVGEASTFCLVRSSAPWITNLFSLIVWNWLNLQSFSRVSISLGQPAPVGDNSPPPHTHTLCRGLSASALIFDCNSRAPGALQFTIFSPVIGLTVFMTYPPPGHFHFTQMLFGLHKSVATLQYLMDWMGP